MTFTKITENLVPESFITEAINQRRMVFLAVHGDTPFLLIRLDDQTGELLAGLSTAKERSRIVGPENQQPAQDGLGFHTVAIAQGVSDEPGKLRIGSTKAGQRSSVDTTALKKRIAAVPHFVMPLCKNTENATYQDRISIGRARNMDIVLRNGSISKFHAWFERDASGFFSVADTGSKNGTTVKGRSIGARTPCRLSGGDEIMFGSVGTSFCPADVLWDLLHE
ncbi:MAG: FHA domain-containing protein [Deltaproteobacteria bacterium]|nr:FHA domain-containing protein [Deltaproteobacteria bacterium]